MLHIDRLWVFINNIVFQTSPLNHGIPVHPETLQESRIVSGWPADPGQFPHHISLRMADEAGRVYSCGGSIIHAEWGLTAAHCTAGWTSITVRAGTNTLNRPEIVFEAAAYYNHPLYDGNNSFMVQPNDIALLKFGGTLIFTHNIQPIRLQSALDKDKNYSGLNFIAIGWERTRTLDIYPENQNWVYLRGVSNLECWMQYQFNPNVVDSTICAHYYNITRQSTCQADSGGPLIFLEEDGYQTQIGVSSFVPHFGCNSSVPAGFVRVGYYHDWFTEVTGINFDWGEARSGGKVTVPVTTATPLLYPAESMTIKIEYTPAAETVNDIEEGKNRKFESVNETDFEFTTIETYQSQPEISTVLQEMTINNVEIATEQPVLSRQNDTEMATVKTFPTNQLISDTEISTVQPISTTNYVEITTELPLLSNENATEITTLKTVTNQLTSVLEISRNPDKNILLEDILQAIAPYFLNKTSQDIPSNSTEKSSNSSTVMTSWTVQHYVFRDTIQKPFYSIFHEDCQDCDLPAATLKPIRTTTLKPRTTNTENSLDKGHTTAENLARRRTDNDTKLDLSYSNQIPSSTPVQTSSFLPREILVSETPVPETDVTNASLVTAKTRKYRLF